MKTVIQLCKDIFNECPKELLSDEKLGKFSKEYSTLGTLAFGYYSSSMGDLFVYGVKRGKLVKR